MDDETEDKILYQVTVSKTTYNNCNHLQNKNSTLLFIVQQTYLSHMKLMSKIAVGLPTGINMPFGYFWRAMRSYALKPEVLVFVLVLFVMLFYLQVVDVWSRALLGKIHYITSSKVGPQKCLNLVQNVGPSSRIWMSRLVSSMGTLLSGVELSLLGEQAQRRWQGQLGASGRVRGGVRHTGA